MTQNLKLEDMMASDDIDLSMLKQRFLSLLFFQDTYLLRDEKNRFKTESGAADKT